MPALLNIAPTDEKPLYIDPSDITALHVEPADDMLTIYNSKGRLTNINYKNWGIDVDVALKKLKQAGTPLMSFPFEYNGQTIPHYISPAAVTFATISQPTDDGMVGAIIGVKGVGREESWHGVPQEKVDALLAAVHKLKPMLEYMPEDAYSRYSEAAELHIDPKSVMKIVLDGSGDQVNVYFSHNTGSLDVQVKAVRIDPFLPPDYVRGDLSPANKARFDAAFRDLMAYKNLHEEEQRKACLDFANTLAAANGGLINIPGDTVAHLGKEHISYVNFYDDVKGGKFILTIHEQESPDHRYGDMLSFRFNTAAERQKAFEVINTPVPQKPKAPPRNPSH